METEHRVNVGDLVILHKELLDSFSTDEAGYFRKRFGKVWKVMYIDIYGGFYCNQYCQKGHQSNIYIGLQVFPGEANYVTVIKRKKY